MLSPTVKQEGKTRREKYLAKVSERTFFSLWSFPNVYTDEGKSKFKKGNELCDLLVVFENTVIIFSDKDVSFGNNPDLKISWARWFKKAVLKSCKQLFGAESWIKKFPERIFLDINCINKFPIDLSNKSFKFHLIAVTCNSNKPAKEYFGKNSTSSLYQAYPLSAEECLEKPFVIGDLFPDKSFIHILDEITLDLLLSELDTIRDFICYLDEKERAIRSKEIVQATGEEEILAYFYHGKENIEVTGKIVPSNLREYSLGLGEGLWEEYRCSKAYSVLTMTREKSQFWDMLIAKFSSHIINGDVCTVIDCPFEIHENAVRHLASENRISRYILSGYFYEKYLEVPPGHRSARMVFSPTTKTKLYVFLFFPKDEGEKEQDYRKERFGCEHAYSLVAKYLYPEAIDVVVIATETRGSDFQTEDILAIEYDRDLSAEEQNQAKSFMEELNVLSNTTTLRANPFLKDLGVLQPYYRKNYKIGRNDKCPCGSGKKFKRCCINKYN